MSTIETLRRRFETAKAERDRAIASLRSDGRPVYAADEEPRRRTEIENTYKRQAREIDQEIRTAIAAADAERVAAGPGDPIGRLTGSDLQRVNALRSFIAEDADALTADDIAQRIHTAVESNDAVQVALWWRYGHRARESRFPTQTPPALTDALARIESGLTDSTRLTAAQKVIADAHSLANQLATEAVMESRYPGAQRARPMA